MPRAALAVSALLAALVVAPLATSSARGDHEQIHYTAADQAAARAAVIRRADLGSPGWAGGSVKPDVGGSPNCPGYNPKQSDLVLTGAASSHYRRSGVDLTSDAQVLKTRSMVSADWSRTVTSSGTLACLRRTLVRTLPASEKLVSFAQTSFPRVARFATRFRGIIDVHVQGQHARVLMDIVLVGRSRTELTLTVVGPAAAKASLSAAEVRLARVLLARARA